MQKISLLCKSCEHLYIKDGTFYCDLGYELEKFSEHKIAIYGVIECYKYRLNVKEVGEMNKEKDRFEELYSKLAMNCFDEINDWEQTISEMREIYRALKQENLQLVETIKTLRDSKISVSKAPSRWIDEIVDSLKEEGE